MQTDKKKASVGETTDAQDYVSNRAQEDASTRPSDALARRVAPEGNHPARRRELSSGLVRRRATKQEPGVSNTRFVTPLASPPPGLAEETVGSHSGRAFGGGANTRGSVLNARIDALTLAWVAEPAPWVRRLLERATLRATRGGATSVRVGAFRFAVQALGRQLVLTNADVRVLVHPGAPEGWSLACDVRALYLAAKGGRAGVELARDVLRTLATNGEHEGERLRRLDLAVDATGVEFHAEDQTRLVGRFRKNVKFSRSQGEHPTLRIYGRKRARSWQCTGLAIGYGQALALRLYDKTEELRSQQNGTEKAALERATWAAAGWDGVAQVWRCEVQLRARVLRELGVSDPEVAVERLDALWAYLVGQPGLAASGWLRLTRGDATRRERATVDGRWLTYQSATFDRRAAPILRRRARRGGCTPQHAIGALLSTLGGDGALDEVTEDANAADVMFDDLCAFVSRVQAAIPADDYLARREAALSRFWSVRDARPPDRHAAA